MNNKAFKDGERIGAQDGARLIAQFIKDFAGYAKSDGEDAAKEAARGYLYALEDKMAELENMVRG